MAKRPRTAGRGAELLRYRAGNVGERGGRCNRPVVVTVRGPWWASLEDHAACGARGRCGPRLSAPLDCTTIQNPRGTGRMYHPGVKCVRRNPQAARTR